MIHALRRRHRLAITALAVLLPIVFAAGLALRTQPAIMNPLPAALSQATPGLSRVLTSRGDLLPGLGASVRVLADSVPPSRMTVEITPSVDPHEPDLLVYWSALPDGGTNPLPPDAHLLGSLAGIRPRALPLPDLALTQDGALIVYSLAHGRRLATTPLPTRSLLDATTP